MITFWPTLSPVAHQSMSGQGQERKPPSQLCAHTCGTGSTLIYFSLQVVGIISKYIILEIEDVFGVMNKDFFS